MIHVFLTWCYWLLMLTKVKVPWQVRICFQPSAFKRCYDFRGAQGSSERKINTCFPRNSRFVLECHLRRLSQAFMIFFLGGIVFGGLVGSFKKTTLLWCMDSLLCFAWWFCNPALPRPLLKAFLTFHGYWVPVQPPSFFSFGCPTPLSNSSVT